jgi:hypothetical protein
LFAEKKVRKNMTRTPEFVDVLGELCKESVLGVDSFIQIAPLCVYVYHVFGQLIDIGQAARRVLEHVIARVQQTLYGHFFAVDLRLELLFREKKKPRFDSIETNHSWAYLNKMRRLPCT